ncbi:MAG: DNA mismatch repair endonuclease MutL [Alistipes sp.]|nr:DNA mismatch repair endonuclease MutL [Alistipes sp.]
MENKIRLLPEIVANQIAAGEVVESPSSVVKEMMENAIDAGAKSVVVNYRNAGLELLQIVDDGCGMSPMDARMAFDRHATSKIKSFDDIYRLNTFGFRGEALASIAAVAQVELRTRQATDEIGTVTIVNGGEFISQNPIMCPVGSQFLVRNLFYTAPARRKFSSDRTKIVAKIKREFKRVALCNPQVKCELLSNDMPILTLPATTLMERIIDVVGRHIKRNLLEVAVDTSIVKIAGYVGRPSAAKKLNNEQYIFVNGRYFQSPQIYRAIMRAYEKLIPEKCTPSYFLYLTVDAERVDVNVSPHKTEVRFADAEDVNQIIHAAVRSTLAKSGNVAMMDFDQVAIDIPVLGSVSPDTIYPEPRSTTNDNYNPFSEDYASVPSDDFDDSIIHDELATDDSVIPSSASSAPSSPAKPMREFVSSIGGGASWMPQVEENEPMDMPRLKDVSWSDISAISEFGLDAEPQPIEDGGYREIRSGMTSMWSMDEESHLDFTPTEQAVQQTLLHSEALSFEDVMPIGGGYAVAMSSGRAMVVDLRRAKERVLYDGYMAMMRSGGCPSQKLLFPEMLTLGDEEYQLLEEHQVEFAALGFDMVLASDGRVELAGIPSSTVGEQADTLLYDLLQEVAQSGSAVERMREEMVCVMAVRGSRTMGRVIAKEEAEYLLRELSVCGNYTYSPSGKMIMSEMTLQELKTKLS